MKKLYEKSEIWFALAWIGLYVITMNIGVQFAGGLDGLAAKSVSGLLAPVVISLVLAAAVTVWICRSGLQEKYGLCRFRGNRREFLFFVPLILMSLINATNGLGLTAPLELSLLMAVNMAAAGYVEEVIFRGFLFRAMAKDNLRSAVIVSAVTFGAEHIVNLANTEDTLGVLLQVGYAMVIGLLYTAVVYKGGSLWPCIFSHMFVNGSSVFALEEGPFTDFAARLSGSTDPRTAELFSCALLVIVSGGYALWLWRKTKAPVRV